jgi:hypothetical protein
MEIHGVGCRAMERRSLTCSSSYVQSHHQRSTMKAIDSRSVFVSTSAVYAFHFLKQPQLALVRAGMLSPGTDVKRDWCFLFDCRTQRSAKPRQTGPNLQGRKGRQHDARITVLSCTRVEGGATPDASRHGQFNCKATFHGLRLKGNVSGTDSRMSHLTAASISPDGPGLAMGRYGARRCVRAVSFRKAAQYDRWQ